MHLWLIQKIMQHLAMYLQQRQRILEHQLDNKAAMAKMK